MRKLDGLELDQEEDTDNSLSRLTCLTPLRRSLFFLDGSAFTDAVLNLFLLGWFIVGQFWTWSVYMPTFEFGLENPNNYCHKNVYMFTLIHFAFVYVMFLATVAFLVALTCCATFPNLIIKTPR